MEGESRRRMTAGTCGKPGEQSLHPRTHSSETSGLKPQGQAPCGALGNDGKLSGTARNTGPSPEKVLSVLGTAHSGKGLTRTGLRGLTYSRKDVTGQRQCLFSQKQIPRLHTQTAFSKEKEGLRETVITHGVTSALPSLSVSPLR